MGFHDGESVGASMGLGEIGSPVGLFVGVPVLGGVVGNGVGSPDVLGCADLLGVELGCADGSSDTEGIMHGTMGQYSEDALACNATPTNRTFIMSR